jgi:hypothetical protein
MARYRAHLMVYGPDGKRLGISALKHRFPDGLRYPSEGLIGYVGSRNGNPGVWVDLGYGASKARLAYAVRAAAGVLVETGLTSAAYTTNDPSHEALRYSLPEWAIISGRRDSIRYAGRG